MFCKHCGVKNEEEAKFCTKCGKVIGGGSEVQAAEVVMPAESVISKRKMTNKLLCRLTVWPWVITIILALLMVFAGDGVGILLGTFAFIGGLMILVFGIWGLIRLAKAKHRIATIVIVLIIVVLFFQKVEIISDLGRIGLLISIIIGLIELNKLPDTAKKS